MDEEEADPALSGGSGVEEIVPEEDPFDPRNFVVTSSENITDCDYQVGRIDLVTEPVATAAAIAIAITVSDGKLLVALPEAVWRRTIARRKLRRDALTKPALVAVAGCLASKRGDEADIVGDVRAWVGYLAGDLEVGLDFVNQEQADLNFGYPGEETVVPFGPALVEVAQEHFSFHTADSAPGEFMGNVGRARAGQEDRLRQLEESVGGIKQSIAQLLDGLGKPKAPVLQAKPKSATKGLKVPGFDAGTVQAALASGITPEQLKLLGGVMKQRPQRLEEVPRARTRRLSVLSARQRGKTRSRTRSKIPANLAKPHLSPAWRRPSWS